ncbi:MAG: DUF1269 domain-containing protein [Deltaproteobacteria bacterium]|nr:DUF1269 domain-containing protein [Deltaproteobacteria bacterium]
MSTLIAIAYESEFKAREVRLKFAAMQQDYLIDLEDSVVAEKKANGKVKLHQAYSLTANGAVGGTFWGALIGLIFMNPLLGAVLGAASGAAAGALSDVGINDQFMKELADKFQPGTSVLFVLARQMTFDKVLDALRETGGTIVQTSLSNEDQAKLEAAIRVANAV